MKAKILCKTILSQLFYFLTLYFLTNKAEQIIIALLKLKCKKKKIRNYNYVKVSYYKIKYQI